MKKPQRFWAVVNRNGIVLEVRAWTFNRNEVDRWDEWSCHPCSQKRVEVRVVQPKKRKTRKTRKGAK